MKKENLRESNLHLSQPEEAILLLSFKDSTIFTIVHRLSTIANYEKVLVMDKGKVIEFEHPYILFVKNVGDNSITNLEGVFHQW